MESLPNLIEELEESSSLKFSIDKQITYNFFDKDYSSSRKFLGAHPINMAKSHLEEIVKNPNDFLICEKSDGVRYLMIVLKNGFVLLHGRYSGSNYESKKQYLRVKDLEYTFFRNESNEILHIFDGELIENNQKKLEFLLFDTLFFKGNKVFSKNYLERLELAKKYYDYLEEISEFGALNGNELSKSIQIRLKDFYFPYDIKYLLNEYIDNLDHENDGLIFTKITPEYISGQNDCILKWKPSHLTTIDFLLIPNPKNKEYLKSERIPMELYLFFEKDGANIYELIDFAFCKDEAEENMIYKQFEELQLNGEMNLGLIAECSCDLVENSIIRNLISNSDEDIAVPLRKILLSASINNNSLEKAISSLKETLEDYKTYDFKGSWQIHRIRNDKSRPNSVAIGRNVLKVIRDNIDSSLLISSFHQSQNNKKVKMY